MTPELKDAIARADAYIAVYDKPAVVHPGDPAKGFVTLPIADLRLILAALAEREWRPIETLNVTAADLFDGFNVTSGERYTNCHLYKGKIVNEWGDQMASVTLTHWLPLPDGPETQQPGERGE